GTGCTGSGVLNGTHELHSELEDQLAGIMGTESAELFTTGYVTNQGVIQALAGKGDIVFSDKDNHACIVAGTQVSLAETWRYRHNDVGHLRRLLEKAVAERPEAGRLIVTDGVFSMNGVIASVPELVQLAEAF